MVLLWREVAWGGCGGGNLEGCYFGLRKGIPEEDTSEQRHSENVCQVSNGAMNEWMND